jgi:hypothetical protein
VRCGQLVMPIQYVSAPEGKIHRRHYVITDSGGETGCKMFDGRRWLTLILLRLLLELRIKSYML